ncbi:GH17824 [Drosophila grimshawi]|uniref:GH17824 n=1 Tax=Drosophila grimshawi TaxID=7222 RepID=B4JWV2_DROGR|nr:GH17824 [Drosophila grimshawi]
MGRSVLKSQLITHTSTAIALIASLAFCAADVSHLSLSRNYLPPQSGAGGAGGVGGAGGYSYPSTYTGSGGYSNGGYSNGGYGNAGYYSGSGLGSSYSGPLVGSGYNNYASGPQYNSYATPSSTYLPAQRGFGSSGFGSPGYSGLDTKYAANGGYVY